MAGSKQKKEARDPGDRLVSTLPSLPRSSSRVSQATQATGEQGLIRMQGKRVEQRSNASAPRQGTRSSAASRAGTRGRSASSTTRKSRTSRTNRPSPAGSRFSPGSSRDTQFIDWARDKWGGLEPHHQQQFFSTCLLILSLLLFSSLTIFRTTPVLGGISTFFLVCFGWSAYLLALGLVAFALTHLLEGMHQRRYFRWSFVGGLLLIWLLLLVESRLMVGPHVGALAELFALPFLGFPAGVGHVLVIGLLLIVTVFTFHITFGHILLAAHFLQKVFTDPAEVVRESRAKTPARSPYLGQRPRFSRYVGTSSGGEIGNGENSAVAVAPARQLNRMPAPAGSRRPVADTLLDDDDMGDISFEADFADGDEDDPLNDIAIHQAEVGLAPHVRAIPRALDLDEHKRATQGAQQQPLSFEQGDQTLAGQPSRLIVRPPLDMEPLPPNPRLATQSAVANRGNGANGGADMPSARATPVKNRAGKVAQAPTPAVQSLWKLPETSLLNNPDAAKLQQYGDDTESLAKTIQDTLRSFRVDAEVNPADISIGPTIIRFGIRPTGKPEMRKDEKTGKMVPVVDASGNIVYETRTRVSRIMALQNDLALVLEAKTIRMEAPVPGRPYIGVEIPNKNSRMVTLREVLESKEYQPAKAKSLLAIGLGKDVAGVVRVGDLARMPHLLIAGATGSGKSVCINTIIASILLQATPDDVRLLMVDPKMVELNMYNGIPHLLSPVVIEVEKVVSLLKNAISEMERRYRLFSQLGVRNLDGYRKLRVEKMAKGDNSLGNLPAIVIIIDELADLMMAAPEEVEGMICRLAQLARATGIHLVVATQRPSVDVITGLIKANIPTRISFMVSSAVDSRTIIDMGGAERLLGRGDMLYLPADAGRPERIQGAFLSDDEAQALADYWRQQMASFEPVEGADPAQAETRPVVEPGWELHAEADGEPELEDDLLDRAEDVVREYGRASISLLQRRLRVGYSRAARLIDLLEERGIIGQSESGGRAREVYDNGSSHGYDRRGGGEGHSMADEVADIVAEERARDEFLRNQVARFQQQGASSTHHSDDEDDLE